MESIDIYESATVNLNYGYYIPTYVGANANYSCVSGSAYYTTQYTTLLQALQNSANDSLGTGLCSLTDIAGRPHPILNLVMFNVKNTSSSIGITDFPITYYERKLFIDNNTSYYYILNNNPGSFVDQSPIIKDEGSSKPFYYSNINKYVINGYFPSSWSGDNGYIFYEKDSG